MSVMDLIIINHFKADGFPQCIGYMELFVDKVIVNRIPFINLGEYWRMFDRYCGHKDKGISVYFGWLDDYLNIDDSWIK